MSEYTNQSQHQHHGGASRAGRVRKKNTLLADFESLENHADQTRRTKTPRRSPKKGSAKGSPRTPNSARKSQSQVEEYQVETPELVSMLHDDVDVGDLEIDLPDDFNEEDMPHLVAAEEIIHEGFLNSNNNSAIELPNTSANRLKSQAQSTYMLEKQLEVAHKQPRSRNSLAGIYGPMPTSKPKVNKVVKREPVANPVRRVTAYMVWAKDYKTLHAEKFPHIELSGAKLGEMWNRLPQAQKKMWKNRAAKQMKGNGENIKNTAPPKRPKGRKRTKPLKQDQDLVGAPVTKKSPARGKGKKRKPPVPEILKMVEQDIITPPLQRKQLEFMRQNKGNNAKSKVKVPDHITTIERKPTANKPAAGRNVNGAAGVRRVSSPKAGTSKLVHEEPPMFKVTGTEPIDAAAHLLLLGESLSLLGQRLKQHDQVVTGGLSVVLDAVLCASGPILCLLQEVEELKNAIPQEDLKRLLNDIATIMPGF